jgi:signal transduction histidine kinase
MPYRQPVDETIEIEPGEERACIFVVDDDPIARETLIDLLPAASYHLEPFASGVELLAYEGPLQPDVILLDVMMPEIDGFEVSHRLKAEKKWPFVPIILITALDSRDYLVRGLRAGADDYLSKPVNGLELKARVRSMVRLKRRYDQEERLLEMREKLTNMVVHDMRQPLGVALLRAQLIQTRDRLDEEDAAELRLLVRQLHRLETLATDLLLAAKMEEGALNLNRTLVDFAQIVAKRRRDYEIQAKTADLSFTVDMPSDSELLYLDENLMTRVMDNLVSNAIKFSPPHTAVCLRLRYGRGENGASPASRLRMQVIDQGPGIPPADRERIFDQFEIVEMKGSDRPSQTGLGLVFCKMVVEAHDGRIDVTANQPRGSIFTVEI